MKMYVYLTNAPIIFSAIGIRQSNHIHGPTISAVDPPGVTFLGAKPPCRSYSVRPSDVSTTFNVNRFIFKRFFKVL